SNSASAISTTLGGIRRAFRCGGAFAIGSGSAGDGVGAIGAGGKRLLVSSLLLTPRYAALGRIAAPFSPRDAEQIPSSRNFRSGRNYLPPRRDAIARNRRRLAN